MSNIFVNPNRFNIAFKHETESNIFQKKFNLFLK